MISEAESRAFAAQDFNRIPMVLESFADLDTPLSLYLKLAHQRFTFLLESVVGGERFGRYSFIGLPAKVRIRVHGRHVDVEDRGGVVERFDGVPHCLPIRFASHNNCDQRLRFSHTRFWSAMELPQLLSALAPRFSAV